MSELETYTEVDWWGVFYGESVEVSDAYVEVFYIECERGAYLGTTAPFLTPIYRPETGRYYVEVVVDRLKSNLDLYSVCITGLSSSSYTRHFLTWDSVEVELRGIKRGGISFLNYEGSGYFFTN